MDISKAKGTQRVPQNPMVQMPWVQADVHTYCNLRLKMPSFAPCCFMLESWGTYQEEIGKVRQDRS